MKSSKLKHQGWIEQEKYIQITLREPFYNAGRQYGWEGEGFGISADAIRYAEKVNKDIQIEVLKYDTWQISPKAVFKLAHQFNSIFVTRDGTTLIVIPRVYCKMVAQKELPEQTEEKPIVGLKDQQLKIV